ncbi:hypothetical protein [Enterococcus sp. DIV0756]|uniref:hypothetical protein n=1 Tax=Enterococcus sp. DIV0756 TaxID=2774636 RepID=UPI003F215A13
MLNFDLNTFVNTATKDPEFSREIRYFNGRLQFVIGERCFTLTFSDGTLVKHEEGTFIDPTVEILIQGDDYLWEQMLKPIPKPFFQCLQTTQVRHGMQVSDKFYTFAYLPALNRMVAIMRAQVSGGVK